MHVVPCILQHTHSTLGQPHTPPCGTTHPTLWHNLSNSVAHLTRPCGTTHSTLFIHYPALWHNPPYPVAQHIYLEVQPTTSLLHNLLDIVPQTTCAELQQAIPRETRCLHAGSLAQPAKHPGLLYGFTLCPQPATRHA